MQKDYTDWHRKKAKIEETKLKFNFSTREVWWCCLGLNLGFEEDGKNHNYERPVLVLRKFNKNLLWVLPLTTTQKEGEFYHKISIGDRNGSVILSQVRTVSSKRLLRRMGRVSHEDYKSISSNFVGVLKKSIPADESAGSRAPSGDLYSNDSKKSDKNQVKLNREG